MIVLVTGGLGYIGSHVISWLAEEYNNLPIVDNNLTIVILDNLCNSKIKTLSYLHSLHPDTKIIFHEGDVRHDSALETIFSTYKVNVVIHIAALKAVKESMSHPLEYYDNNVSGTIKLLTYMKNYNCKNLIFSSSATVYGTSQSPIPVTAKIGDGITNPYGQTKYMMEMILRDVCEADKNFHCTVLRYFNPIGAHPSGFLGESPNGTPNNLFPYIVLASKGTIEPLTVFGNDYDTPDGTCIRDYIDINDLALAHVAAIRKLMDLDSVIFTNESNLKIYNVGTGKGISVLELIYTFENVNRVTCPFEIGPRRPGDLERVYAEVDEKTFEALGWRPRYSLEDSCHNGWLYAFLNE